MSMHLSDKIDKAIKSIYHQFNGHMGYRTIDGFCRMALKPFGIRTTFYFSDELDHGDFTIAGQYDSERKRQPIQITLVFSRNDIGHDFSWNEEKRKKFCFELSQVSQHELIHKQQAEARNTEESGYVVERDPQKQLESYLGNKDEIEAYAHDIALEMKHMGLSVSENPWNSLNSYQIYKTAFDGSDWKKVHDRLIKKVVYWMENL